MKKIIFPTVVLFFLSTLISPLSAQNGNDNKTRTALIIGNSAYKNSSLKNPVNDATDMARTLRDKGFDVILITNADQKAVERNIRKFGRKLRKGGVGLFYYAGHGVQVRGINYLIPVGADIQAEHEVKYKAVPAEYVLGEMESADSPMNIVILDACRDNPFARSFRSSTRGLARMNAPKGTIIVYSTSPGNVAQDGAGRNAPFTKYLVKEIRESNLEIDPLLREVRRQVLRETNNKQMPWAETSLIGQFFFTLPSNKATSQHPAVPSTSTVDLSDIRLEGKWRQWQLRFKNTVDQAKKIDQDPSIKWNKKKEAWQRVKANFREDNPFTKEDNALRVYIDERIIKWGTEPVMGLLEVLALPYAEVFVDGKSYGEVPPGIKISLQEGQHQVVLKMGSQIFQKTITIEGKKPFKLTHKFVK